MLCYRSSADLFSPLILQGVRAKLEADLREAHQKVDSVKQAAEEDLAIEQEKHKQSFLSCLGSTF